jgi:TolB protein
MKAIPTSPVWDHCFPAFFVCFFCLFTACGSDDKPTTVNENSSGRSSPQIAFVSARDGNFEIYVMDADGSNPVRLTNHPEIDFAPAWSPDGTKIALESTRDGNAEIYVMHADGSEPVNLTNHPAADSAPTWSPDGEKIAFASRRISTGEAYADDSNLYIMNSHGTHLIQLGNLSRLDESPAWSPRGDKIAFVSFKRGKRGISTVNANGDNFLPLTSAAGSSPPTWSPDSNRIAFASNRNGDFDVYAINVDGSRLVRLTYHPATDESPAWSPDGKQIAFTSLRDGNYEIYVVNVDGKNLVRVTHNDAVDRDPVWRPQ